ncbi:hypothetical protein H0H87_005757 [Tephrocybe sp. NHM501043]|nr:hypothetical protein H0H87_005757 [Tephrocybe sp. NHM501043]
MADVGHLFNAPPHPFEDDMRRDFKGEACVVTSRTKKPVKYYLLDFDLSREYLPGAHRLEIPPWGGDKSVPEHLLPGQPLCDPFPVDVYCLGNCIRRAFLDGWLTIMKPKEGFEFMRELIDDMTNPEPEKRPQMKEAVARLEAIVKGLSDDHLRSPVLEVGQHLKWKKRLAHWAKQRIYKARGIPAIPKA